MDHAEPPFNFQRLIVTATLAVFIAVLLANAVTSCATLLKFVAQEEKNMEQIEEIINDR